MRRVPIDDASREALRGLIARIDLDETVAHVRRAIEGMPEYRAFVEGRAHLADRGPAGIRWNLEAFLRWAVAGATPRPADLRRLRDLIAARAAEGRPPEEGLAVYRRALRAGWEAVLAAADERERAALGGAFDVVLDWLEIVSRVFEQAYAEERDALVSTSERRARRLLEQLVGGGPVEAPLAEALRFRLADAYRPLVVALPGAPDAAAHLRLAHALREHGALATAEGRRVVGVAHGPVRAPADAVTCELAPVAPGELADALADLRTVADLAAAAGARGPVAVDAYLPELLLARSPRLAGRLAARVFGPLAAAGRDDLARTLELLARHGYERGATAAALPVHRNTLAQRIARIEQLTGLDLDDPSDRGLAWLAARGRALG